MEQHSEIMKRRSLRTESEIFTVGRLSMYFRAMFKRVTVGGESGHDRDEQKCSIMKDKVEEASLSIVVDERMNSLVKES